MDNDPFRTQRGVASDVITELGAAGFSYAEEVGRGGFGVVYRCTQLALDRVVAVKVLTAKLDDKRERFLREQRAMGRLTGHPNIVGVLQVGETDSGFPYLVMQYHKRGSLQARIHQLGFLPLDEVVRLGVKMAGALQTAHERGILHRDVKPANILLTDYGEPALADFGIAHIPGAFHTATGIFTGSPAFAAPETVDGEPPGEASDIYGLGATLFAALTGHAAFERRSGEQVMAQFVRIASESAPDLRKTGIPDDISDLVERAMSRDPGDRPSATSLGEELQRLQRRHGFTVDEMLLQPTPEADRPQARVVAAGARRSLGNLPLELTSFVGRRTELAEVKRLLTAARLVTLTGIGGIGKTRLALRAAAERRRDFPDGEWLVELSELRHGSLLADTVATSLGVREESSRPAVDTLLEFLSSRKLLLVLDNCEQVVDEAAKLAETLLRACPELRILATSREALGIGGEAVLRLSPLTFPNEDTELKPRRLPGFDAVALFTERAAAAVPGFQLTDDNLTTVARICAKLDGLPLAIELAAARLRATSLQQILERLSDRYTLLTRGSRNAPMRQQTLRWSIGWSYDLCTPDEQQLWDDLSVFSGSFEMAVAQSICAEDQTPEELLDRLSALVDKSILIRTEHHGFVRYRLMDSLRDYALEHTRDTDRYRELRRRHVEWCRRLVCDANADWFSPRQVQWMQRLEREGTNIRAALEFSLTDSPQTALEIAGTIHLFAIARGRITEMRGWLDRALQTSLPEPSMDRLRALYGATVMAGLQADVTTATVRAAEIYTLVQQMPGSVPRAVADVANGFTALVRGEFDCACEQLEGSIEQLDDLALQVTAMMLLGWALQFRGELGRALIWQEKALALTESHGESVLREHTMWSLGVGWWQQGKPQRAEQLLLEALRLTHLIDDPRQAAANLAALGWISARNGEFRRAAVLMAAAESLGHTIGASNVAGMPHLEHFHQEAQAQVRAALGAEEFDAARLEGDALSFAEAVVYATGEEAR